jgi:hypothetical protein
MPLSTLGSARQGAGQLTPGDSRTAAQLFYSGWALALLYVPSGLMHVLLGKGVYARDVLLGIHLCACIYWLNRTRRLEAFARRSWLLLIPGFFLLPAIFNDNYTVEAVTFLKWTVFWLDWIIMGGLALEVIKGWNTAIIILVAITALLLVADLAAGTYERVADTYIFDTRGEKSSFGVEEGRETKLAHHMRVKGLQRDVFSYANLMAASCVGGLLVFVSFEPFAARIASLAWTGMFGIGMFLSGGRSAFFGVFGAGMVAVGLVSVPGIIRRHASRVVLVWLLTALTISLTGIGTLSESIGSSVMSGSHIGNSNSAYERDANWTGIIDAIENNPVVLVSGGPLASLLDPKVDAIYHWADNQYLWLVYHSGVVGLGAMCLYFAYILKLTPAGDRKWLHDGLVLYLLFVMGEAMARESLTFIGCMPLFLFCGCHRDETERDALTAKIKPSSRRAGKGARALSDAEDFARRVRNAAARRRP